MTSRTLEYGESKAALEFPHFPAPFQAVIWRNWGIVPRERIAKALHTDLDQLDSQAALLGLQPDDSNCNHWLARGYQTIIRQNWHLVEYWQLLTFLDWTPEQLAQTLQEDDFLWIKLGNLKPAVTPPQLLTLSPQQYKDTIALANFIKANSPQPPEVQEAPFAFLHKRLTNAPPDNNTSELRLLYAYSALYGDPLMTPELEPFTETQLDGYAASGINALWLQGVLYTLVPWLGEDNPISAGWQKRIQALGDLCDKMQKRNIRLFLYINEPRGMPESFFEDHPDWRGAEIPGNPVRNMCTSNPVVLSAFKAAITKLFQLVPKLGGLVCITRGENLTGCWAHYTPEGPTICPRCRERGIVPVIREILNAIVDAAHEAKPDAEIYLSNWAWYSPWDEELISTLPVGAKLMCISETDRETVVGGHFGIVRDYSISKVGPGPVARRGWDIARKNGLETCAKVQINNSWELSAVPYIPVPGLVEEHLTNLRNLGIHHLMLSWTTGGYPGGNLRLLNKSKIQIAEEDFGPAASKILAAYACFDEGFRHLPFDNNHGLYVAPMNFGPGNLLFEKPTGYRSTMIGFPYDDLINWRDKYPENIYEEEFRILCEFWKTGLDMLHDAKAQIKLQHQDAYADLSSVAEASYCHFRSTYLQIKFVRLRDNGTGYKNELRIVLHEELRIAQKMLTLQDADSRLGYEASNHYYYTHQTLLEKILNCNYLLEKFVTDVKPVQ